ncbi:MAG TPA: regulatory protein RecX [Actinomycetota bacterium]|jgi:regulatory protein
MPARRSGPPASPKSCHERALGLLAVRPRSRRELETRLLRAGFEAEEVSVVVERLERVGLIDDEAFARQVAEHEFGRRRSGARRVSRALAAKGVARPTIEAVLAEAPDDEAARAHELAAARATRLRGVDPAKAFARLSGLLMRRGYAPEVARDAARTALSLQDAEEPHLLYRAPPAP